jgi:hypothetical protein
VKSSEAPHINKHSSPLCVDAVFHRNVSAVGGPDLCILPATLGQTSPTQPQIS